MDIDHEIALMYAPNPWNFTLPSAGSYSPFSNIILRVVQPPRPSLEDLVLQLLAPNEAAMLVPATEPEAVRPLIEDYTNATIVDPTPNLDLSERMACEMQRQEDWEQDMRDRAAAFKSQIGEFMSSLFGNSGSEVRNIPHLFSREPVDAEAGPSTAKKPGSPSSSNSIKLSHARAMQSAQANEEGEIQSESSDKKSGKKRAQSSQFDAASHSPTELLDGLEAALRQQVNRFNFPERLEFEDVDRQGSRAATPPIPVLSDTPGNVVVHEFERALLELDANLDVVTDVGHDEVVAERLSQLGDRIRRELEDLDRKVLEAWAATRRYLPANERALALELSSD